MKSLGRVRLPRNSENLTQVLSWLKVWNSYYSMVFCYLKLSKKFLVRKTVAETFVTHQIFSAVPHFPPSCSTKGHMTSSGQQTASRSGFCHCQEEALKSQHMIPWCIDWGVCMFQMLQLQDGRSPISWHAGRCGLKFQFFHRVAEWFWACGLISLSLSFLKLNEYNNNS